MERRRYPRLDVRLPLVFAVQDSGVLTAESINISLDGLQLACGQEVAHRIAPKGFVATPSERAEALVHLELPFVSRPAARVEMHSRVVNVRRLAANEYRIGLAFMSLDKDAYQMLRSFLDELLHRP